MDKRFIFIGVFTCLAAFGACSETSGEQTINTVTGQTASETVAATIYVSQHDYNTTVERLKAALAARQLNVFTQVDHAKGAEKAGLELGRNHLVLFGNPKVGTLLMQQNPQMGIELPMKALVYEQSGKVKVRMTDIKALAAQYDLKSDAGPVPKVTQILEQIAREATE